MVERIQRKRTKGWRMPPNTVSVTRPGKWGNQWKPERFSTCGCHDPRDAVRLFRLHEAPRLADDARRELRGKNLACFCALDQPCHADVLIELANSPPCIPQETTVEVDHG